MKIKITYQTAGELKEVLSTPLIEYIKRGGKLRKSDRYEPYRHAYITIKNAEKGDNGAGFS